MLPVIWGKSTKLHNTPICTTLLKWASPDKCVITVRLSVGRRWLSVRVGSPTLDTGKRRRRSPPALYPNFPDLSHNWFVSAFFADPQSGRSLGKSLFSLFDFRNEITSTTSKEGCAKSCFHDENHAVAYKGTNETPTGRCRIASIFRIMLVI